jgi:putative toxin-antitoxin system antitoxin component (TIGR02293 family)
MSNTPNSDSEPYLACEEFLACMPSVDRIEMIRRGLPAMIVEHISTKFEIPIHKILTYIDMPQTTYNKKIRGQEALGSSQSEQILAITDLLTEGLLIFNNEKSKFDSWLSSSNLSLNGRTPMSLFDTQTGLREVQNCLHRIEYGNFA